MAAVVAATAAVAAMVVVATAMRVRSTRRAKLRKREETTPGTPISAGGQELSPRLGR
jgi:hypothetical protein